jgi:hypothetical protein
MQQLHALYALNPVAFDDMIAQLRGHLTCVWYEHHPQLRKQQKGGHSA